MEYVMQGNEDAEESPRETESNRTDAAAGGDNDGLSMQDGHTVHLVYSEYDDPPSETAVEVIEGPQHYWWSSVKSPLEDTGRYYHHAEHGTNNYCTMKSDQEVCLVYSEYSEPSTETSIDMDQFFNDKKKTGREVRLVYSECEEPPSETDVEYDGRPWCSLFGNPALWKIQEQGREMHLTYSEYSDLDSETFVEATFESNIAEIDEFESSIDILSNSERNATSANDSSGMHRITEIEETLHTNEEMNADENLSTDDTEDTGDATDLHSDEESICGTEVNDSLELLRQSITGNDSTPVIIKNLPNLNELLSLEDNSFARSSSAGNTESEEMTQRNDENLLTSPTVSESSRDSLFSSDTERNDSINLI